jgi:hypothetical protein
MRWFLYCFCGMFVYFWFPEYVIIASRSQGIDHAQFHLPVPVVLQLDDMDFANQSVTLTLRSHCQNFLPVYQTSTWPQSPAA